MKCKKCGSENVNIQKVSVTKKKRKGILYWAGGWFIDLMAWLFLTNLDIINLGGDFIGLE